MPVKMFTSAVVVFAAALSGCAMCENCDDNGPPVALDTFEGAISPTGRVGSALSGAPPAEYIDSSGSPVIEYLGSAEAAGSGTRVEPIAR